MPLRLLTYSSLYPSNALPTQGLFVEHRLRALLSTGKATSRVVAPVPWFPFRHSKFGRYGAFARVEPHEVRHGICVSHPRYPVIPKVGMAIAPALMARATLAEVRRQRASGFEFDAIDAHFFYPDGVAAVRIARILGRPAVITARGSDITLYREFPGPRAQIVEAALGAAAVITVSQALNDAVVELGVPPERVHTMRNGVDLELFRPVDRQVARKKLGMVGQTLLAVGNLLTNKGHDLAIRALAGLPGFQLVLVGAGPERASLLRLIDQLGLKDRCRIIEPMPQESLREYYGAADALVLCSAREGWPNVLLEAMACGTPVVATPVWGIPEIVRTAEAGKLMPERSADGVRVGVTALFEAYPDREQTRRFAEQFSWEETSRAQLELFGRICASSRADTAIAGQ